MGGCSDAETTTASPVAATHSPKRRLSPIPVSPGMGTNCTLHNSIDPIGKPNRPGGDDRLSAGRSSVPAGSGATGITVSPSSASVSAPARTPSPRPRRWSCRRRAVPASLGPRASVPHRLRQVVRQVGRRDADRRPRAVADDQRPDGRVRKRRRHRLGGRVGAGRPHGAGHHVPDGRADDVPERPPAPRTGRAWWRLGADRARAPGGLSRCVAYHRCVQR